MLRPGLRSRGAGVIYTPATPQVGVTSPDQHYFYRQTVHTARYDRCVQKDSCGIYMRLCDPSRTAGVSFFGAIVFVSLGPLREQQKVISRDAQRGEGLLFHVSRVSTFQGRGGAFFSDLEP